MKTAEKHPYPMGRRAILLLAVLMLSATAAVAQQGLNVATIFSRFGKEKGCRMVEIHDTNIRGYELHTYQSLTFSTQGDEIAPLLEADRKDATKIREVVNDGRVESGYYVMSPADNGLNRYVLYTQKRDKSGAVIYIEGKLMPDDILTMCYRKR